MSAKSFKIGKKEIGPGHPVFIVAEISGNHHGKYEEAAELVRQAAQVGADAVKLQTYTPDTITLKSNKEWFVVGGTEQPQSWKKKVLWDLYQEAHTPWEWQPKLKELAESLGLIFFSAPFDDTAVDFLEKMKVPCYKIASYEAVHIPLLQKVAQTHKPIIMSIGFATLEEAILAVKTLKDEGAQELAVLHCVTAYSDRPRFEYANLNTIRDIADRFGVMAGFSDNNAGLEIPVLAATLGNASILEKHFILDRSLAGPDARFSLEPKEFKEMVSWIRKAAKEGPNVVEGLVNAKDRQKAMGQTQYGPASQQERENMFFRPSLWIQKDIKKGEQFTKDNIRAARPSVGLAPKYFAEVLGKKAAKNIDQATPLTWDLVQMP